MKPSNVQDATVQKTVERSFLSDASEMGDPESHAGAYIPPTVEYSHLSDASTLEDTVVHLARMDISAASTPEDSSFLTEPPEDSSSEEDDDDDDNQDEDENQDEVEADHEEEHDGEDTSSTPSTPTIKREMSMDTSFLPKSREFSNDRPPSGSPIERVHPEQDNLFLLQADGTFLAKRVDPLFGQGLFKSLAGPLHQIPTLPVMSGPASASAKDTSQHDGGSMVVAKTRSGSTAVPVSKPRGKGRQASSKSRQTNSKSRQASDKARGVSTGHQRTPDSCYEGIVPDHVFALTEGIDYDRQWMEKYHISQDALKFPNSRDHLSHLVRHKAVVFGERMCLTYLSDAGHVIEDGIIEALTDANDIPSGRKDVMQVRMPTRAGVDRILRDPQGPRDFVDAMNAEFGPSFKPPLPKRNECWSVTSIISTTGENVGTLKDIRQAHELWFRAKVLWKERKDKHASEEKAASKTA